MELVDFLRQTQQQVRDETVERGIEGGEAAFPELLFTEIVTRHMADIGMTFDPEVCAYDARVGSGLGSGNVRLSGFAVSEDNEQLDLYVSDYEGLDEIVDIPNAEAQKAAEQCLRFLSMCVEGKLAKEMDESHPAYALVLTIKQVYPDLEQIRVFVLTDRRAKVRTYQPRTISGKVVKLEVMDIQRLFNHWQEGRPRDELIVNFHDISGGPLPCIWVPDQMGEYDYAMTAIPGEALRFLYEKYGARILEANVRSFLSQVGGVNKGIAETLRKQPERFMAYNNGVVIIADEASLGRTEDGSLGIFGLKGMQIVNGGQTTASMFFTKKKFPDINLSQVRVPAKIIVLKNVGSEQEERLISDISRYANSQNKVQLSDLSANMPYHVELEKLAMATYCPDGVSRWFYERATGSYKVMLEREGKTPAGIKRIQEGIPSTRKITKTDLAKYQSAWMQRPDLVSLGGQKNFKAFMDIINAAGEARGLTDVAEYKSIIAQVILFKEAQRRIRPRFVAFQANVIAYTVSLVSLKLGERLSLERIWSTQTVSPQLLEQIEIWSDEVNTQLHATANGRMISEWAKRPECREIMFSRPFSQPRVDIPELNCS
ncbi:TPA: MZA anti-phage system associated AIPR family protein MzaE [Aeromonas hydrophila]